MIRKKRGIILVVLVLMVVSIAKVGAVEAGEIWPSDAPGMRFEGTKSAAIVVKSDCDSAKDCDEKEGPSIWDDSKYGKIGCKDGKGWPSDLPYGGCYVFSVEKDDCGFLGGFNDDSYGYGLVASSFLLLDGRKFKFEVFDSSSLHDGNEFKNPLVTTNWRAISYSAICREEDHRWYICDDEIAVSGEMSLSEVKANVNWVNITAEDEEGEKETTIYVCAQEGDKYVWMTADEFVSAKDNDGDGTGPPWDCDDNDDEVHGGYFGIQPHPEICGDGKNNDCLGGSATEKLYEQGILGTSSDDCDENEFACRGTVMEIEGVQSETTEEETAEIQGWCMQKGNTCSWIENAEGNNCCGDDGLEDLGQIKEGNPDKGYSGNFVCLTQNKDLVGYEVEEEKYPSGHCGDSWCWVNALGGPPGGAKFTVFTIKNPGEKPYDIVSNSDQWLVCDETYGEKPIPDYLAFSNDEQPVDEVNKRINRFYCYREGDHWSWAECAEDLAKRENEGVKGRFPGESLYTLSLFTDTGADAERYGANIDIKLEDYYREFYGEELALDFSGYTHLNFMLQFCKKTDEGCETISQEELNLPAGVKLRIFGPADEDNKDGIILFEKSVLGDVINNPFFSEENWMHVKVELPENLKGVKGFRIDSEKFSDKQEINYLKVRNIYLSKSGANPLCSGDETPSENDNSWLTNLDKGSGEVTGEKLCKQLYGETAWLGKDNEVDLPSASCCGNEQDEYYAGASKEISGSEEEEVEEGAGTNYGCWNSQPVADKETTMDVEYSVDYKEKSVEVNYPEISFEFKIDYIYPTGEVVSESFPETVGFDESPKLMEKELEWNFPAQPEGDRKWAVILGHNEKKPHAVRDVDVSLVPKNFKEFSDFYGKQAAIKALKSTSGFEPKFAGKKAIFQPQGEYKKRNRIWITWLFVNQSFSKKIRVTHDDNLGIALANNCFEKEGLVYRFNNSKADCKFSTNPMVATTWKSDDKEMTFSNKERYVYAADVKTGTATLEFTKGWNVLMFVLDNDGGDRFRFWYTPLDEIFIEDDPRFIYMNSNGAFPVYPERVLLGPEDTEEDGKVKLNFFDYYNGEYLFDEILNLQGKKKFLILAETDQVEFGEEEEISVSKEFVYPCSQPECLYPIPGIPEKGITITNKHPNLYELYYVYREDEQIKEELITKTNNYFEKPGNIKAKKVAQQVIFTSSEEEEPGFYGCKAATYLNLEPQNNLRLCSIRGGKFCSPSATFEPVGKEKYTTINSWSDEPIEQVGYDVVESEIEDIEEFFKNLLLPLKEEPHSAEERNHTATVLPARNFISNAEFLLDGSELPHWEVFVGEELIANEKTYINKDENSANIAANEFLRTERIAVNGSVNLYFWHNGTADYTISLYDKDGQEIDKLENPEEVFNSKTASYLIIKFTNGEVRQPFLQLVDDLGTTSYYYQHQEYPDSFDARAGLSCCPDNYCWNGYACVEPMTKYAQITEHIAVGRDYRCIDGEWKYQPVKWDWNNKQWGFCSEEQQCFVLNNGKPEFTAADFYNGNFPLCVNNNEYIFDHYCQQGNWTSRTKFLATKLIEVAETNEHVLYCTNYRDALLDYQPEIYLGGESFTQIEEVSGLGEAITEGKEPEIVQTCFPEIQTPEGKSLVSDKENTCINNVCVLKFKEGGKFKAAFATTLNKDLVDKDSFLLALNVPQGKLNEICAGEGEFVECALEEGDLWYSPELNAMIYGKEGIKITPTVVDKIIDWFKGLFGVESELSEESKFVAKAQDFRELYLLNKNGKSVKAMREIFTDKKTLVAEYENFDTPVCSYVDVYSQEPPIPELEVELLEKLSGMEKVICNEGDSKQRVEVVGDIEALDFFWPQLTGKLRVGDFK